jgi:heme/copper-type cytochrome/quinol oxidase subunit 2
MQNTAVHKFMRQLLYTLIVCMPISVAAQIDPSTGLNSGITIRTIFARLTEVMNLLIPFLVLLATVIFIWGIVRYVTAGGDEQKIESGRNLIIWGIIALAVMLTVWGFVNILISAIFGTSNLPNIPGPSIEPFL